MKAGLQLERRRVFDCAECVPRGACGPTLDGLYQPVTPYTSIIVQIQNWAELNAYSVAFFDSLTTVSLLVAISEDGAF